MSLAEEATRRAATSASEASGWDQAVGAWERVLEVAAQQDIEPTVRAVLFDHAAGARLRRSQLGGPAAGSDAAAAADGYGRAVDLVDRDSPDRRAYLNNLGFALLTLWGHERCFGVMDDAVAALEAAVAASAPETPDGVAIRLQFGATLRDRHRELGRPSDLDAAVGALSDAVAGAAVLEPEELAESHEALGSTLYDLYQVTRAGPALDQSIDNLRAAWELTASDADNRAGYADNFGSALLARFQARDDREDLTGAVRVLEEALDDAGDAPTAELLANLGNALSARSVVDARREDSDQAVAHLTRAVTLAEGTARLPGMLSNLAAAKLERFDLTGQIAEVDEAVDLLVRAVDASPVSSSARPARLNNLGIALRQRHLRRRAGRADLDRAIAALREALSAAPAADPERPAYHANLGNALHQRFDVTHDSGDLDSAVDQFEEALAGTPENAPDRAMYLNNLSATLAVRAEQLDRPADLRRAAQLANEGLELAPESSARRAGLLVNLGNSTAELFDRLDEPEDRAAAQAAYRSAARDHIDASPADALAAARNWSEWAARRTAWSEAVEAYAHGEQAAERLFRTQVVRAHKESWLRDADGLAAVGALGHAARAELADAVMALELGRARLYSERLEREHADLRRLQSGREELALRYRAAAARVGRLEGREEVPIPR